MDTRMSLMDRIQARINNANKTNSNNDSAKNIENGSTSCNGNPRHINKNKISDVITFQDTSEESESDVEDHVTLEQCIDLMERKSTDKNSSFTRLVNRKKSQQTPVAKINLRDVVSNKKENVKQYLNTNGSTALNPSYRETDNEPLMIENIEPELSDIPAKDVRGSNEPLSISDTHLSAVETCHYSRKINIPGTSVNHPMTGKITKENNLIPEGNSQDSDSELPSFPLKKRRVRLTDEEKAEQKRQKELEKLERQRKREEAKREKESAKLKEKATKQAMALKNRSERKDECMRKMLAVIDPALVEGHGGAGILKDLQDAAVSYELKSLPISSCMGWMRENAKFDVDDNSQVQKHVTYDEEKQLLHVITANELAIRVDAEINANRDEGTLISLVKELREAFPKKKITIVITGLAAYYRLFNTKQNRVFRNQVLGIEVSDRSQPKKRKMETFQIPVLQKNDVERSIAEIQTVSDIYFRTCDNEKLLGEFIVSFTKAIAEAPFKKTSDDSLQFCAIAPSDKQSIKVFDDGRGINELWNQQLQQFYGVRHETSVAITQHFPTPLALMKAYEKEFPEDGPLFLQDIEVRRGVGVLQTHRRIGPELSKRVHKLMTSRDGEILLAR